MASAPKNWLWIRLGFGAMFAGLVVLSSGLIDGWGRWYSPSPHYRHQTEALLRGELALSHSPNHTLHDLTWSQGGVHQVWGLGVPLWRLPFEAAARIAGLDAFPDRIAFAFALACWAAVVLGILRDASPHPGAGTSTTRWYLSAGLILVCPVFLQLCTSRFDVYEEAVAYEYLFGTGLLAGLLRQIRAPSLRGTVALAAFAGLGPLIRPTLLFYGMGTLASLVLVSPAARTRRHLALAAAAFAAGPLLVLATNQARFGHPMEFGHQLNLQHLFGSMYATRFDHPFIHEPMGSAARELLGLLFGTPEFNGHDFYRERFFEAQSPTLRWRELYLRTYDAGWLVGIVTGWLAAARSFALLRAPASSAGPEIRHRCAMAAGICSAFAAALLFAFYLRNGVISSRYLTDFAPAFVAALLALTLGADPPPGPPSLRRGLGTLAGIALAGWYALEAMTTLAHYPRIPPVSLSQWRNQNARPQPAPVPHVNGRRVGTAPESPEPPQGTPRILRAWDAIPHDGAGWDKVTGETASIVILFVSNPDFIEADVTLPKNQDSRTPWVRARLGRHPLQQVAQEQGPDGRVRLRFAVEEFHRRQAQPLVLFLAFGPPESLHRIPSGYRLHSVSWN